MFCVNGPDRVSDQPHSTTYPSVWRHSSRAKQAGAGCECRHDRQKRAASWLWASLLLFALVPSIASAIVVEVRSNNFAWSGPMAVLPLLDNWNGSMEDGDDGFFWQQHEIGFQHASGVSLTQVSREHAEYLMPNRLALGFYYEANEIALEDAYDVQDVRLEARHYQGEGINLGYLFDVGQWRLQPSFTWLRLFELYWGTLDGDLYYLNANEWGGTVDLSYGYTEDKVVRRELDERSYGDLYALDLRLDYQSDDFDLHYQGYNLLGRIVWDGLPYTDARLSTTGEFALFGREYFEDSRLTPSRVHNLEIRKPWRVGLAWNARAHYNPVRPVYEIGLDWQLSSWLLTFGAETKGEAVRLAAKHRNGGFSLLSSPKGIESSRLLGIEIVGRIGF